MAISFNDTEGQAKKSAYFKFEAKNTFRLVGGILPRYVYWINTPKGDFTVECLSFDRNLEKFTNVEKDWVTEYFPDKKCAWAYLAQCINLSTGKLELLPLRKKMFASIKDAAKKLGDPTDWESGWDIVVEKRKTGPAKFNVEYVLMPFECKNRPLSQEERAMLNEQLKPIDEVMPRPTSEEQKAFLERLTMMEDVVSNDDDEDASEALNKGTIEGFDDDIPF